MIGPQSTLQPGARVLQGSVIGRNVSIDANTVVRNSVILDDATVAAGTVITDSIIGAGAVVGQSSSLIGGRSNIAHHGELFEDVRFGSLIGDRTRVGGDVSVHAGSIIGNEVTIESGTSVKRHVQDNAFVSRG